jgi:hypothetical protein
MVALEMFCVSQIDMRMRQADVPLILVLAVGWSTQPDSMTADDNEMLSLGVVRRSSCRKLGRLGRLLCHG